jgi:hypothetical protein
MRPLPGIVRGLALAVAVFAGACGTPAPSEPPTLGTIRVAVQRVAGVEGFFASEHHATLVAPDGRVIADWKLPTDGEIPVQAPVGSYTLSTFTVFLSDFLQCTPDPARPGEETCFQPTLGPVERCEARIDVRETTDVLATFSIMADGHCRLELGTAPH